MQTVLSDQEKKKIIRDILGANHNVAGKNLPILCEMMNGLGSLNDVLSFAELIPVLKVPVSDEKST